MSSPKPPPQNQTNSNDSPANLDKWKQLIYGGEFVDEKANGGGDAIPAPPVFNNAMASPSETNKAKDVYAPLPLYSKAKDSNDLKWQQIILGEQNRSESKAIPAQPVYRKARDATAPPVRKQRNINDNKWEQIIYGEQYYNDKIAGRNDYFHKNITAISEKFEDDLPTKPKKSKSNVNVNVKATLMDLSDNLLDFWYTFKYRPDAKYWIVVCVIVVACISATSITVHHLHHRLPQKAVVTTPPAFESRGVTPQSDLVSPEYFMASSTQTHVIDHDSGSSDENKPDEEASVLTNEDKPDADASESTNEEKPDDVGVQVQKESNKKCPGMEPDYQSVCTDFGTVIPDEGCPFDHRATGCTSETLSCSPLRTYFCNTDSGRWKVERRTVEGCLDTPEGWPDAKCNPRNFEELYDVYLPKTNEDKPDDVGVQVQKESNKKCPGMEPDYQSVCTDFGTDIPDEGCPYDHRATGCTSETLSCSPLRTYFCNTDSGRWKVDRRTVEGCLDAPEGWPHAECNPRNFEELYDVYLPKN